ncbi:MAG TPA: sensor histidine kinase [Crocinitomix sp.]|nr:sensor histidine kinase [Crocinitomix sp.]
MNLSKPINIIVIGSTLLSLLILFLLLILKYTSAVEITTLYFVLIPLIVGVIAFFTFSFLIEKFINKKIKLVYRIISSQKLGENKDVKITEDVLEKLSVDTAHWAMTQKNQIELLKQQNEFRKEFLGNLAHELKTPVFSVQGFILTLLEGGLEDETVNRVFLEKALNGVDRITALLEDLDDISKIEYDNLNLKIKSFDIVDLTQKVFDTVLSKAKRKNITLEFNKLYHPIFVKADKDKIAQVLINLINNAISYSPEGKTITLRFHNIDKKTILIEVADNGLGIEAKHLPRLFERFYRVDKSRARNVGGSGLGLAIVKHIIEAHNQTINVRSTIGKGSTFSFTLEKDK